MPDEIREKFIKLVQTRTKTEVTQFLSNLPKEEIIRITLRLAYGTDRLY